MFDGEKRINSYYPAFVTDIYDIKILFRTLGMLSDGMEAAFSAVLSSAFPSRMEEPLLGRFEEMLGIKKKPGASPSARRAKICAALRGYGHIGAEEIKNIVGSFTDSPCEVGFAGGTVGVATDNIGREAFAAAECASALRERLPAHLALRYEVTDTARTSVFAGAGISEYRIYSLN